MHLAVQRVELALFGVQVFKGELPVLDPHQMRALVVLVVDVADAAAIVG
jgi:hypothetical protein